MTTRQDCALALASLGFRIFPLRAGSKEPFRTEGWKAIMTSDPAQIERWFEERPDMNYAVVCDDKHIILDPDAGTTKQGRTKEGIKNFLRAEDEALGFVEDSIMNNTLRVRTPKGGIHLYFVCEHAYANSVSTIIQDVDVRGPDGYVVGPGCWTAADPDHNTVEGDYEIETECDIAPLPDWLREKLDRGGYVGTRAANAGSAAHEVDTQSAIEQACRVLRLRKPAVEGEGGDAHTVATAMQLKDYGVSEDKCFELMFTKVLFSPTEHYPMGRSWNETCEPPWDFEDLRDKVHNGYAYGNRQIGAKMDALSSFGGDEVAAPAADGMDAMQQTLRPGEHYSAIEQPIGKSESASRVKDSLYVFKDFLKREVYVESIVNEWILAYGVTAVLAKRGTGKSVFLEDLAMCIATDTPWNGIQPAADWAVIYLCGEDDTGLQRNLQAWQKKYGKAPTDERFMVASAVPNLMDAEDVRTWAEELKARFKGRRVVVIVDTWQRATSNASQNDDKEMQKAIHQAEGLARYLNGCAIIAFHPPKGRDDTISGSMVMENSTTAILAITSTGGTERHVEVMRIKGPGEGHYAKFNITSSPCTMTDKDGAELTGALPIYKGGNGESPQQERLDREAHMREVICLGLHGPLTDKDRIKKGVTFKEVANHIIQEISHDPEGEIGKYFQRSRSEHEITRILVLLFAVGRDTPIGRGAIVKAKGNAIMIADGVWN